MRESRNKIDYLGLLLYLSHSSTITRLNNGKYAMTLSTLVADLDFYLSESIKVLEQTDNDLKSVQEHFQKLREMDLENHREAHASPFLIIEICSYLTDQDDPLYTPYKAALIAITEHCLDPQDKTVRTIPLFESELTYHIFNKSPFAMIKVTGELIKKALYFTREYSLKEAVEYLQPFFEECKKRRELAEQGFSQDILLLIQEIEKAYKPNEGTPFDYNKDLIKTKIARMLVLNSCSLLIANEQISKLDINKDFIEDKTNGLLNSYTLYLDFFLSCIDTVLRNKDIAPLEVVNWLFDRECLGLIIHVLNTKSERKIQILSTNDQRINNFKEAGLKDYLLITTE